MKKSKKLIVECYITAEGADYRWDDLPSKKKDEYNIKMTENCRRALIDFYRQNPQYICCE